MTIISMSIIADAQIALSSALALFGSEPIPVGSLVVALVYPQSFLKTEGKIVLAATVEIKRIDRKGMNFDVAKVITVVMSNSSWTGSRKWMVYRR